MRRILKRWLSGDNGSVAVIAALVAPVLIGALALGGEAGSWYASTRAMQNAADAAAIAAASNAGSNYDVEARAVVAKYGFSQGVGGVNIAVSDSAPCPAGGTTCYSVVVTRPTPLLFAQVIGYRGDADVGGSPAKLLRATAVAERDITQRSYCILALGKKSDPALRTNGAPNASLTGCSVMSNNDATCNGHDLGADYGDAHGRSVGCGAVQDSNMPVVPDPYAKLANDIPPDPCKGSYPQEPTKKTGTPLPPGNLAAGAMSWSGVKTICGDLKLTGDTTITSDTTLVIYNGDLDTNGFTLQSAADAGVTIIFAGTNSASYTHVPTGGGTIDIAAPTSGDWSGVALYQAPSLTQGVDISAAGNSPTWNITGVTYFPNASVTFSGAVNKASNGQSCFGMVADNVTINGTGSIMAHGACGKAGVTLPTGQVPGRGKLVA